jgi:PEP-CTERM motif
MKHKMLILPIVGCCILIQMDQAGAATMFSNLGQTAIGSMAIASDSWRAEEFYTGANPDGYLLNSIQIQLDTPIGVPSGFSLGIYDRNGVTPGNSLELLARTEPSGTGIFTFQSSGLVLHPNSGYFVVATATTPLSSGSFQWDITSWVDQTPVFDFGAGGLLYHSSDGNTWTYSRPNNFMFAVNATVIPEPSTLVLAVLGLAAIGFWRFRQSK